MYGGDFRENTASGFILRIVAESKIPKEAGNPNKDGVLLSADPRDLFLNASLRCRCLVKVNQICSTASLVLKAVDSIPQRA